MTEQAGGGQVLDQGPQAGTQPLLVESRLLLGMLNAVTTTQNSPWAQYYPYTKVAIEVLGLGVGDSVQMVGSCAVENPDTASATASHLGSAITANGITFADWSGVRWIQAQFTASAGGPATVRISAVCP